MAGFYSKYSGKVISATIDKYVYVAVNEKFAGDIRVSYSITENVPDTSCIKHTRTRAILEESNIKNNIEVVSMADVPAGTGLGSSSAFTVALYHALSLKTPHELAEMAAHLEIDILNEPIGKQDQYATAYGGLNTFTFNQNTVSVENFPRAHIGENLQKHIMLFYTGKNRDASSVLCEQTKQDNFQLLRQMVDLVDDFQRTLISGNFKAAGEVVHLGWTIKKQLAPNVSNPEIDELYSKAITAGAYGGKILGAGNGGFLLFIAPPAKQDAINKAVGLRQVKVNLTEQGSERIWNG